MAVRLVVLASSRGSNFNAIVQATRSAEIPDTQVVGLVTHNPKAAALERARECGVPSFIIPPLGDRIKEEQALTDQVALLKPDYICLAGYMRIVGNILLSQWPNRILNIHPSLLPAFRGLHAQKQALDSGATQTGCTVHFVNEELDGGPVVAQDVCPILPGDTEETLALRLLPIEHRLYVKALQKLVTTPYQIVGARVIFNS